jgi:hypothetical protein
MADDAPNNDDIRVDDLDYDPALEPRSSKAWLNLLEESEKAFEKWNDRCDNIDKMYASLDRLSNRAREKEFQMFWANCEVLKPSIYAKAPVPVVVPKFKDRRPIYQQASEIVERCAQVSFDLAYINDLMLQVRDDLALIGRGVPWCRYESKKANSGSYYATERVCIDYKHRRDFLHSISRSWSEVSWVAAASYMTRREARERFYNSSGDAYQDAEYAVDKDAKSVGGADDRERAKFWEIWHRGERRVVWVAKGAEKILDEDDPHLDLQNFFPCPKPAYGTLQRGSLVPVPDMMQYKDQLEEVNLLTGKIHALGDALEVKGFYPSGGGELADAIEAAIKIKSPGRILIPISNWAAFGGSKEVLVWLPIDMIAQTVTTLIETRKQMIDDIYQIMGLSDIMRGATDARETLGAQELKTEYGSIRTRDKQYELVRVARDIVCIIAEIICEKFDDKTIISMSQTQLPTNRMKQQSIMNAQAQLQQQLGQLQQQAALAQRQNQQGGQQPGMQPGQQGGMNGGSQNGDNQQALQHLQQQMQQLVQQGQAVITQLNEKPTIEDVLKFLRDNRARSFILDIETDSTIIASENLEKKARTEFVQVLGGLLPELGQLLAADPASADLCANILKFSTAPFRAGRELDGSIDDYSEQIKARGTQGKGDDPTTATNKTALQIEQLKQNRQADKDKADTMLAQQKLMMDDQHKKMELSLKREIEVAKLQGKAADDAAKTQMTNQKAMAERESHQADMLGKQMDMQANTQKMQMAEHAQRMKESDMQARQSERAAAAQMRQQQQPPRGGFVP